MDVLVADDDPVLSTLLEGLLAQWEFRPVMATDGEEAWNILNRPNPPRLLIVDWMMPRMDGFELCAKIRASRHSEHTYILLMTATCNKDDITRILVAGADDYLIKPFDPVDLKFRIRTAMRIMRLQEELRKARAAALV